MRTPVACSALVLLLAAGCSQAPSPQPLSAEAFDPGFARGCWIERSGENGEAAALLRLLGAPPNLSGQIVWTSPRFLPDYIADASSAGIRVDPRRFEFSPQRSGSATAGFIVASSFWVGFDAVSAGPSEMTFVKPQTGDTLHIEGENDRLRLYLVADIGFGDPMRMDLFDGERDGCD